MIKSGAAVATIAAALLLARPAGAEPTAPIIPEPLSVSAAPGPALVLADGASIAAPDRGARAAAAWLVQLSAQARGLSLQLSPSGRTAVVLTRDRRLAGEAYELRIGSGRAEIRAGTDAGLLYGAASLWQLMTADGLRGPVTLQPLAIADSPRFAWRGLMVDSARHFQPPEEIERLIDLMALHKLNVLHWHLTDDQGWRIEIRKYPRLTQVGAWRDPPPGSPDGAGRYGGFYSQADIRRIVAHAAARHVMIVPEIELPGHATSALLAYPQFAAGPPPPQSAQTRWGVLPYVFSDTPETMAFLKDVLAEVLELFPSPYVHIGGDEVQPEGWLAAGATDPPAVQARITREIAAYLAAHGRRMVGWDEVLQGGPLPDGAVVTSWRGAAGALAAAKAGHDAVLAPAPVLYFDNWQTADPDGPPGRGFLVSLKDVYGFEAAPADLAPEIARHLVGLQGQLWTEHIRTSRDIETMAFPRAAALAEDGWTAPGRKDWAGFVRRLPAMQARYAALGVPASGAALDVLISTALNAGAPQVTLSRQEGPGEARYTLDGSDPTAASTLYAGAFAAPPGAEVRALLFIDGRRAGRVASRRLQPASLQRRASQELRLCNTGLALNLEGPPDGDGRRGYLTNPQDGCWIYPAADLSRVRTVQVSFARLPWSFSLDPPHDQVTLHPPRDAAGELEVRLDACTSGPVAVAPLPPGRAGERRSVTIDLPPLAGVHDVCLLFTSDRVDPALALGDVAFLPGTP